jgi:hypothetical protein
MVDGRPHLVDGDELVLWTTEGYAGSHRRPRRGSAVVLTPPASMAAMAAGYRPQMAR